MVTTAYILTMGQRSKNKNAWYNISYITKQMFAFNDSWFFQIWCHLRIKKKKQLTYIVLIVFIHASITVKLPCYFNSFNPWFWSIAS